MSKKFALLALSFIPMLVNASSIQLSDEEYNHLSVSYDATFNVSNLSFTDDVEAIPGSFTLNGMSFNYLHGFHIKATSLPMYIEVGASLGFNNGHYIEETYDFGNGVQKPTVNVSSRTTQKYRNFNLEVPVFYLYRFQTSRRFSIAPYAGFNFKLHLASVYKEIWEGGHGGSYEIEEYDWISCYDKEFDNQWKRFQVGFGGGVRLCLDNKWTFSTQFIWDFNPVLSIKEDMSNIKVHTGKLRLAVGYRF